MFIICYLGFLSFLGCLQGPEESPKYDTVEDQSSRYQHGSFPPEPVYQPAKKQWSTWLPSTQIGLSTCKKAVINMAPFHTNRSINLQKSIDQHGSLPPESVYQRAKNRNYTPLLSACCGLSTDFRQLWSTCSLTIILYNLTKTNVINTVFHRYRSINLFTDSCDQHGFLLPGQFYQAEKSCNHSWSFYPNMAINLHTYSCDQHSSLSQWPVYQHVHRKLWSTRIPSAWTILSR